MRRPWHRAPLGLLVPLAIASLLLPDSGRAASRNDKPKIPAVRWDEERPGCTFSRSDDGRYYYGLWYGDVGITMAVDSQELEKVHRRHEPFFAVLLNVRYKSQAPLDLAVEQISLEFVKHFRVVQTALDPDGFSQKVQNDADELDHQTARAVAKHPEQKEAKEAYVRAFLKDSAELQEFVGKNSLRPTQLGPGNPETSGWVLFSTDSKWISGWKKQEELILRVPLAGKMFEFPFKLPPKPGEVILRRRQ
ncbi:MAG: hypothetical protein ABR881_05350 [Candidatus Sulfotelmatobacter sp.]|jgi:hypothetical protein